MICCSKVFNSLSCIIKYTLLFFRLPFHLCYIGQCRTYVKSCIKCAFIGQAFCMKCACKGGQSIENDQHSTVVDMSMSDISRYRRPFLIVNKLNKEEHKDKLKQIDKKFKNDDETKEYGIPQDLSQIIQGIQTAISIRELNEQRHLEHTEKHEFINTFLKAHNIQIFQKSNEDNSLRFSFMDNFSLIHTFSTSPDIRSEPSVVAKYSGDDKQEIIDALIFLQNDTKYGGEIANTVLRDSSICNHLCQSVIGCFCCGLPSNALNVGSGNYKQQVTFLKLRVEPNSVKQALNFAYTKISGNTIIEIEVIDDNNRNQPQSQKNKKREADQEALEIVENILYKTNDKNRYEINRKNIVVYDASESLSCENIAILSPYPKPIQGSNNDLNLIKFNLQQTN